MQTEFGLNYVKFQSTPPVKAATTSPCWQGLKSCISIHAAREGGDLQVPPPPLPALYFNPRRP